MKNKSRSSVTRLSLCLVAVGMTASVFGDGYRNPPPTAEGIGKSGVNSVFVDDASAISYNPANLALQTNDSLVVAVTFARTENTYKPPIPGASYESDGDWNILPNIYYSQQAGDQGLAFGLGITTPFGQGLSWKKSDFAPSVGVVAPLSPVVPYEASIMLIDLNPTVALKLNESVYLGAGLNVYYSKLELKTLLDAAV
ncbi:MAG: outer membrane protein transport protein, partial [Pontiella sp.]|nr:outer membrane protein transport protein [Pontiella sp.]